MARDAHCSPREDFSRRYAVISSPANASQSYLVVLALLRRLPPSKCSFLTFVSHLYRLILPDTCLCGMILWLIQVSSSSHPSDQALASRSRRTALQRTALSSRFHHWDPPHCEGWYTHKHAQQKMEEHGCALEQLVLREFLLYCLVPPVCCQVLEMLVQASVHRLTAWTTSDPLATLLHCQVSFSARHSADASKI